MITQPDNGIILGGVTLPGAIKSIDIAGSARIEEQEVKGSTSKPKQAVGYDDTKITVELILDDMPGMDIPQQLAQLQGIFHPAGTRIPPVLDIVETTCAARGVSRVLAKGFSSKENTQTKQTVATLTLWEYVPMVISAGKYTAIGDDHIPTGAAAGAALGMDIATGGISASGGEKHGSGPLPDIMQRALTPGTAENERLNRLRRMSAAKNAGNSTGAGVW